MSDFIEKHKFLSLLMLITLCAVARYSINAAYYDVDFSYSNGNHVFDVPLTEKLVQSLKNCTPYRIKHSERLFQQFWTNSWGRRDILLIEPQKNQTCRITKIESNAFSALSTTEFEVEIPLDLARKSAEALDAYLHNLHEKHDEIKAFDRCMDGCLFLDEDFAKYDVGNMFDAGISFMADSIKNYWENWGVDSVKPTIASEQQIKFEEQICLSIRDKLKQLIKNPKFQAKDDFYQAKWMYNITKADDFYILPGGENGKWDMGFMLPNSACYVAASLNGDSRYIFKQIIKKDPAECKCW